jgi:N-acyl homoserine lactone hydrolase
MNDWSIWMLEYATRPEQPIGLVLYGSWNAGTMSVPFSYVYLENGRRSVLIDVGFDEASYGGELARGDGVVNWQSPERVLAKVGKKPADIDAIVVTHAHYDHANNLQAFPNAQVYLQSRELSEWERILALGSNFSSLAGALDPADLLHLAALKERGMLTLIDGDMDNILPGISVRTAFDTHTAGSQYVVIDSRAGSWVVAGDNIYSYANVEGIGGKGYIPIGYAAGSQTENLMSIHQMAQIADGTSRLIVVHEGKTFERFPSRTADDGLRVAELHLAAGVPSRL